MRAPTWPGFAESVLSDDGEPLCSPPDLCSTCVLFGNLTPERIAAIRALAATDTTEVFVPRTLRWSRDFDRCQNAACHSPEARHFGHGFCTSCYHRNYAKQRRRAG